MQGKQVPLPVRSVNCNCNARKTCRGSIFSMYNLVLELFTQKRHSLQSTFFQVYSIFNISD